MKHKSLLQFILLGFIFAFLATSCVKEGPMGPAGADGTDGTDGTDGVDGNVTCLACHSGTSMEAIQAQFAMSVHRAGLVAVDYAGGRAACAQCHSHEGFTQYATFGLVLGDITNPTAWKCNTCHGIHKSFETKDYALRLTDPIHPAFDPTTTMDLKGNSNLCANCHQSRTAEPLKVKPGEETFKITSAHYGPHHGAQANVVAGVGFAEIAGSVQYPAAGSNFHLSHNSEAVSCVGCHMGTYSAGSKGGGHTWKPNLSACVECHGSEMTDYNYGGVQTEVEHLLVQLRDRLVELGVVEFVEADNAYEPVVGTYPMAQARAFFNWVGLEEDRSLGAHNPKYVKALLLNSIEALQAY
ncbi:MAG: ammonia-forming cytochrome c nitrite reductase subunit c552 [Draconibacterium sp.]